MKPQDIVFLIVVVALLLTGFKKPKVFVWSGLVCLCLSIPLFSFQIFFTAQRLLYYSAFFFAIATAFIFLRKKK